MAQLIYGGSGDSLTVNTSNGLLACLQVVIEKRFNDGEGFWFSVQGESMWLHPGIPLRLRYDDDEPIEYSREVAQNMLNRSRRHLGLAWAEPNESVSERIKVLDPEWKRPNGEADQD